MTDLLKNKKVLITLDGSKRSLQTAAYACRLRALQRMEINLFHVLDAIPDNFWDIKLRGQPIGCRTNLRAWEAERKKLIRIYMDRAEDIFLSYGFNAGKIKVTIQQRKMGIARDIVRELNQGYDLLITRRRGMGAIRSLVVGSVTAKLLEKVQSIPVILAGQEPYRQKFLVAVDGSENANRALDFVSAFLQGSGCKIRLVHVVRGGGTDVYTGDLPMPLTFPESFMQEALEESTMILNNAKQQLLAGRFEEQDIECKTITGVLSRAVAIADEARENRFSTIVIGRKGLSCISEFSMGRVTKKIVYMARRESVWIIP